MYNSSLYLGLVEDLSEKLNHFNTLLDVEVLKLQTDELYYKSLNRLLLETLNLREFISQTNIEALSDAFKTLEDIFSVLKYKKPPIKQNTLDMLLIISDYINSWSQEIETQNYDIQAIDRYTLYSIKTSTIATYKTKNILLNSSILFCTKDETSFRYDFLQEAFVLDTCKINECPIEDFSSKKYDVILVDFALEYDDILKITKNCNFENSKLIALIDSRSKTKEQDIKEQMILVSITS